MSPALLRALLHYYAIPAPYPGETEDIVLRLAAPGLIVSEFSQGEGRWKTTPKGNAYVEALLRVPLPEDRWVVPGWPTTW